MTHEADRPALKALPSAGIRATVVVALHNHAKSIEECLESLLSQWLPELELLLIDDASTDDGFAIAERILARHLHIRAITLRNKVAVGMGVLPMALSLARGAVVIQADGDDVALPGRLEAILACFDADPTCRLVTSNAVLMSADGFAAGLYETMAGDAVFTDPLEAASVAWDRRWLGATMGFHRSVFDALPPLDPANCLYGLDRLLPLRAVLLGSHHYLSRPLVGWRQHGPPPTGAPGASSERSQSIELMVLAQKLRDAEHAQHGEPKPAAGDVVAVCKARLAAKQDEWSRLWTGASLAANDDGIPARGRARRFPARPPVTTLHAGQRIAFASRFGGAVLAGWPGFHPFDGWCVWTQRHALVCLRVPTPDVTAVRVAVRGLGFMDHQRVSLSAGGSHWKTLDLHGGDDCPVDLAVEPGIVGLFISAQDAAIPPSGDSRLLGVGLLWVEAVTELAARSCVDAQTPGIQTIC